MRKPHKSWVSRVGANPPLPHNRWVSPTLPTILHRPCIPLRLCPPGDRAALLLGRLPRHLTRRVHKLLPQLAPPTQFLDFHPISRQTPPLRCRCLLRDGLLSWQSMSACDARSYVPDCTLFDDLAAKLPREWSPQPRSDASDGVERRSTGGQDRDETHTRLQGILPRHHQR